MENGGDRSGSARGMYRDERGRHAYSSECDRSLQKRRESALD